MGRGYRNSVYTNSRSLNKKFAELLSAYNMSEQPKLNLRESTQGYEQPNEQWQSKAENKQAHALEESSIR